MIRAVRLIDATEISRIYNHYIVNSPATFEEAPLTADEMQQRIEKTTQTFPWLVCEEDGKVVGYAYARQWRERAAYRYAAEASVYLDPSATGKGTGSALFQALLAELHARKFHCLIGGVALPNPASVALLEKFGLRQVARFKETGYKLGNWIDVGYWQLLL